MDLFEIVVRYEIALWNAVDRRLRDAGLITAAQLQALVIIERRAGDARVQDISSEIGITVGAASKFVDRLEREGLVERRPHPLDRRSSLISPTTAGTDALTAAAAVRDALLDEVLEPDTANAALTALTSLFNHLQQSHTEVLA